MLDHHLPNRNRNGKWKLVFHLETLTGSSTFTVDKPKEVTAGSVNTHFNKKGGSGEEKENTVSQNYCVLISRRNFNSLQSNLQ